MGPHMKVFEGGEGALVAVPRASLMDCIVAKNTSYKPSGNIEGR